jgi:hypothetical protein
MTFLYFNIVKAPHIIKYGNSDIFHPHFRACYNCPLDNRGPLWYHVLSEFYIQWDLTRSPLGIVLFHCRIVLQVNTETNLTRPPGDCFMSIVELRCRSTQKDCTREFPSCLLINNNPYRSVCTPHLPDRHYLSEPRRAALFLFLRKKKLT